MNSASCSWSCRAHKAKKIKTMLTIEVASAGFRYKPGGFQEVSRPIKIVVIIYTSFVIVTNKINDDDDEMTTRCKTAIAVCYWVWVWSQGIIYTFSGGGWRGGERRWIHRFGNLSMVFQEKEIEHTLLSQQVIPAADPFCGSGLYRVGTPSFTSSMTSAAWGTDF